MATLAPSSTPMAAVDVAAAAQAACLDPARLPRHVAIVMDGNGRWAKQRGWIRTRGHESGAEVVRHITTECVALGIQRLTLYAFSSENWSRPATEVAVLMDLLGRFLERELATLMRNGVQLAAIGRLDRLPARVRQTLDRTITATAGNPNTILTLALSYGGRDELVDACRAIAAKVARGELAADVIDAATIQAHLYAGACPNGADDVDLVIRTAGEQRLSNFLPWQATYAEFVSCTPCWPEFKVPDLHSALREYQARKRTFGSVS
jgi:undecaprenyl diphosphate synthase